MLKLTCLAMSAVCSLATGGVVSAVPPDDRLVYVATNLLVDANVEKLTTLLTRAKKAGYTGVLLADSKFGRLGDLPDRYAANCRKVKASAQTIGIEIIPRSFRWATRTTSCGMIRTWPRRCRFATRSSSSKRARRCWCPMRVRCCRAVT